MNILSTMALKCGSGLALSLRPKMAVVVAVATGLYGCTGDGFETGNFVGSVDVSGTPTVGSTLTAETVDPDGVSTAITYAWTADGVAIAGATGSTLVLEPAQAGTVVAVTANYIDDSGNQESPTDSIGPIVGVNNDGMVAIDGTPTVGETLTAMVTDADGISGAIGYQWAADGTNIAGATADTLTLTDAQFGAVITVTANYSDDSGFPEVLTSAGTAPVAGVNDGAAVAVTGTPTAGETLTATVTDPDGISGAIAYQWAADGADIAGATAQTYTLTAAEVGTVVTVRATYTDDQNFAEEVTSAGTDPVAPMLMNTVGMVMISGTVEVGSVLMATVTDANGITTSTIAYQWAASGMAIAGANAAMYTPTNADVGAMLTVTAMYMDDDGFMEMITSNPTIAVPTVVANVAGSATITGEAREGETLTANFTDPNGVAMSVPTFQWSANGMAIAGASANTYVPVAGDVGNMITVTVTYTDDQGFDETVTSPATAAVLAAATNTAGTVAITGTAQVAETLTATVTDTNGTTGSTIAYQWAADSTDIAGATASTYVLTVAELGAVITVTADYTDDDGFAESIVSAPTAAVVTNAVNTVGMVAVTGTTVIGDTLTAAVTDANGSSGTIDYQWQANGADIAGATANTYVLTAAEVGTTVSVIVNYTDDDGFVEGPLEGAAADVVFSVVVTGETSLIAALGAAVDGDVIGLGSATGGDDYADMAEIEFATDNLTVRKVAGSTAVITGSTCLAFTGDGIVIDGLTFDVLDYLGGGLCDANGDGSVYLAGDGVTLRNADFMDEASPRIVPSGDPYHYITVKGVGNTIERNRFAGKDMDNEGSAISIFADQTASNQGHIIQYNLFIDFPGRSGVTGNRDSTAHALQVGRTTGSDAQGQGLNTIRYNRFENIQSERRLMRVQSSANIIEGNTMVNTLGLVALEDGFGNVVRENIILSGGDDNDDGGISFAPLGHTVVDNYINNLRTTSSQRGGLLINPDPLSGSGNTAILGLPLDFTVTVARNTVVNARQAILFDDADCTDLDPILDFDDNFVMNQGSAMSINMNTNGVSRDAVTDADWEGAGCELAPTSTFENNRFYSGTLSESGLFDFNGGLANNTVGAEDGATFTQDANGLVNGDGPDAGVGVDTSILNLIDQTQVGPNSTWTAP